MQAVVDLVQTRANAPVEADLDTPAPTPSAIRAKAAAQACIKGDDAEGFVMDGIRAAGLRGLLHNIHAVMRGQAPREGAVNRFAVFPAVSLRSKTVG